MSEPQTRSVQQLMDLSGRTALVTGGSRGLGLQMAQALGGNRDFMQAVGYNTSKGAVVTFTRALAAEWGAYNITVNAIGPGVFPSKMSRYLTDRHGVEALAARVPLNRVGDEEDLKGTVLLFASDAGKHITGQFLVVDGGASAMIAG